MSVTTRRGNPNEIIDPMVTDPNVKTPTNQRDHMRTDPKAIIPQPPIGLQSAGHGVTTPLIGFTPGVQETRTTSIKVEQTAPGIENPSFRTPQGVIGDDMELQNLRVALGQDLNRTDVYIPDGSQYGLGEHPANNTQQTQGYLKLNTDAAIDSIGKCSGLRMVIQNEWVVVRALASWRLEGCFEPEVAEALAIRNAVIHVYFWLALPWLTNRMEAL
uniref:Uncharacterized protein n=1 Tax=Cannabis sativa TaxID=3483 RepID=A0A803NJM4_CANSA